MVRNRTSHKFTIRFVSIICSMNVLIILSFCNSISNMLRVMLNIFFISFLLMTKIFVSDQYYLRLINILCPYHSKYYIIENAENNRK